MPRNAVTHVIIIGGGASGVLLACHLLRNPDANVRVTLIEKRIGVGAGIAYGTANPDHVLNVRASNMSAFPDQPNHFWRWLLASGTSADSRCGDPFCFVPRQVYGQYIAGLLEYMASSGRPGRLHIIQGECRSISDTRPGVRVMLADGSSYVGHIAVLATGHETPAEMESFHASPWARPSDAGISDKDPVLILGTGLTMVDYVLSLTHEGHTGPIIAMSRRGLLPHVHRRADALQIDANEIPFGRDMSQFLRWVRELANECEAQGEDWRGVIDALRPYTQQIWQSLPIRACKRFLEHLRPWWDIHRHRMAPEVEERVRSWIADGRLEVVAGKLCSVEPREGRARVHFRRRGNDRVDTLDVTKVIDCRGVNNDLTRTSNAVLRELVHQGLARPDPLRMGIDVTSDCAIIDCNGIPSGHLFAVGPLTRSMFWEIVAVPDIRVQCAQLADRIARGASAPSGSGLPATADSRLS